MNKSYVIKFGYVISPKWPTCVETEHACHILEEKRRLMEHNVENIFEVMLDLEEKWH